MAARLIHMTCQNCGANLDLDLDKLIAFCPYCGAKLMVDVEQLSSVLVEKEKTKQKEMELNNKIEYEKLQYDLKEKEKKADDKRWWIGFIVFLLIGIAWILFIGSIPD